jgi:hypothetical protein
MDLASLDVTKFVFNGSPYFGWGTCVDAIPAPTNTGYRYFRVHSAPVPYLNFAWMEVDGVMIAK